MFSKAQVISSDIITKTISDGQNLKKLKYVFLGFGSNSCFRLEFQPEVQPEVTLPSNI